MKTVPAVKTVRLWNDALNVGDVVRLQALSTNMSTGVDLEVPFMAHRCRREGDERHPTLAAALNTAGLTQKNGG